MRINKLVIQSAFSLLKLTRPERPVDTQIHPSETRASPFRWCYFLVSHAESVKETQTARGSGKDTEDDQTNRNALRLFLGVFFSSVVTCYVCAPVLLKTSHTSAGFDIWGSIYTDRISDYFHTLCGTNLMFSRLTTPKRRVCNFAVTNRSGLPQIILHVQYALNNILVIVGQRKITDKYINTSTRAHVSILG